MSSRNMAISVIVLATILLLPVVVSAANPADLTSDSRYCPVRYYKAVYDDGPWYLLAIEPIGDSMSLLAFNWNAEDCVDRQYELVLTRRLKKGVEVAYIHDWWQGSSCIQKDSVMLDLSRGNVGLGIIAPLQDRNVRIGPRLSVDNFTAFLTVAQDSPPLYGVSYCKKGARLDVAYGSETWFFRASKPIDKVVIPELRTKFTKKETFIGFGIAFCYD